MIAFRKHTATGSGLRTPDFKRRLVAGHGHEHGQDGSTQEAAGTIPAPEGVSAAQTRAHAPAHAPAQARNSGHRPIFSGAPAEQAARHLADIHGVGVDIGVGALASMPAPARQDAVLGSAGRSRSIAIATRVMSIVGDTAAGVLLSQLIYWTRRGVDVAQRDGWIFKTAHDWEQETGMSWKVQRRARSILVAMGVIEERKQEMPARLEFRLKLSALVPLLAQRADVVMDNMELEQFRDHHSDAAESLIGRAFLFHGSLARVFPVHSAMMCSRLLAPARLPCMEPQALMLAAARTPGGLTRLTAMQRDDWRAETGLTRDQWQTARRNLLDAGVLVERRHNFPRRVDLAVDMRALAELLRQSAARSVQRLLNLGPSTEDGLAGDAEGGVLPSSGQTRPYRLDRAKQAGGIGQYPIPPSQSPNPADRDRPIQPIAIAQSHLYLLGLQGSLHPPQQKAQARTVLDGPMLPSLATAWGGGGVYGAIKVEYRPSGPPGCGPLQGKSAAAQPTVAPLSKLVWPRMFAEADQGHGLRHLAGLDQAIQQSVLDEIDWMRQAGREIRSPVALVRALAKRARAGDFVPDGAHRVAAARKSVEDEAQRLRDEAAKRQHGSAPQAPMSAEAQASREKLKKLTADLKRRVA